MKFELKLFIYLTLVFLLSTNTIAQTHKDTLNQFVNELQKDPNNNALREKIISIAQRIKPAPTLPEEARKKFVMGKTLQNSAKTNEDYVLAIEEFKGAVLLAPWNNEFYKELGLTEELGGQYDEAIKNLTFYMLGNLSADNKRNAQDEIYVIEAKKKKAIKDQQIAAELKTQKEKESLSVEGKWDNGMMDFQVTKNGETFGIIEGNLFGQYGKWKATKISINKQNIHFTMEQPACPSCICVYDLSISESGSELMGSLSQKSGTQPSAIFIRKK